MATLDHEPRPGHEPSNEQWLAHVEIAKDISARTGVAIADVIAMYHAMQTERRALLACDGGDMHDRHMAGFGEILSGVAASLARIADAVERGDVGY